MKVIIKTTHVESCWLKIIFFKTAMAFFCSIPFLAELDYGAIL
jgi:hypothetical protein